MAKLETGCLALRGIVCRSCAEHCEPGAIRLRPLPAGRALPVIDEARCTGCGECARVCPAQAIVLRAGPPAPQSR